MRSRITRYCGYGLMLAAALISTLARADMSPEDKLLSEVYPDGGTLLYCQNEFKPGDRIRVDRIYPERQMYTNFGCRNARLCRDPAYLRAASDLHNLFPVSRSADIARRGTRFSEVPDSVTADDCGYRVAFQNFMPSPGSRGQVARAMLYMHVHHELPLVGVLHMYQQWSNEEPPDAEERRRNNAIADTQGNRNPFIDNPDAVNNIIIDLF